MGSGLPRAPLLHQQRLCPQGGFQGWGRGAGRPGGLGRGDRPTAGAEAGAAGSGHLCPPQSRTRSGAREGLQPPADAAAVDLLGHRARGEVCPPASYHPPVGSLSPTYLSASLSAVTCLLSSTHRSPRPSAHPRICPSILRIFLHRPLHVPTPLTSTYAAAPPVQPGAVQVDREPSGAGRGERPGRAPSAVRVGPPGQGPRPHQVAWPKLGGTSSHGFG